MIDWCPRAVYGSPATTLDFELPQRPWSPAPSAIGGSRRSASGAIAAYTVRHDEFIEKHLRFYEGEWPAVRAWLLWAQDGAEFDWYDDQADAGTVEDVTLEAPAKGQPIRPVRSPQFPQVFELTITLRLEDG